jgi:hypothetical protein
MDNNNKKEAKQRYFDKMYEKAPFIKCECGCGTDIKSKDKYGRNKRFVSGHNGRKYEDPKQYKREWNYRNREARYSYKTERLHSIKAELINGKGGKCERCEIMYDGKNACIFDFHHLDPSTKDFNLSMGFLNRVSLAEVRSEAEKCILLCSNCHRIEHSGSY